MMHRIGAGFLPCGAFLFCTGSVRWGSLAGAVREVEMDLRIPLYLSDTSPLTLMECRCGGTFLLPRVCTNIGIWVPVQIAHPHFDGMFGCFVFGLGLFAFQ